MVQPFGQIVGFIGGRRVKKKQRRFERQQAEYRRRAAELELGKFEENLPFEERGMEAGISRRGMSDSSIAREQRQLFRSQVARSRERLRSGLSLASEAQSLLRAQHRYERIMEPVAFLDGVITAAGAAIFIDENVARGVGAGAGAGY